MSKRNKKKLKKILQAQIMQKEKQERIESPQVENEEAPEAPKNIIAQEVPGVGREIRKILLTVFLLVIAIVVIYFINIKTDLILKAGNFLTKSLNIGL